MALEQISFITPTSFVIQRAWRHQAQSPLTSHLPPHLHTRGSVAHMANTSAIAENVVDPASVSMGEEKPFAKIAVGLAYANTVNTCNIARNVEGATYANTVNTSDIARNVQGAAYACMDDTNGCARNAVDLAYVSTDDAKPSAENVVDPASVSMDDTNASAENVVDPASVSIGGTNKRVKNAKEAAYAITVNTNIHAKTATTARAPLRTVRSLAIDLRGRGRCLSTCARSTLVCQKP